MFKKSQLLAAVAAAAAACFGSAASATDLKAAAFADLRYGIDYFNDSGPGSGPSDTSFNNTGSFYGFKGSAEQGGVTVFGGYERWLDANEDASFFVPGIDLTRQSYVGVKTEFGTVQYGTFESAYLESGKKLDPFYGTGVAATGDPNSNAFGLQAFGAQSHGLSPLTADFPGGGLFGIGGIFAHQLAVTSPTMAGVTVNAGVIFDNNYAATGNNQDDYEAGVEWSGMGITAGGQFIKGNSGNIALAHGEEAYRIYGGYAQKRFGANLSAERLDLVGANNADYLTVSGWFGVLEGTRIAASLGQENETGTEGNSLRVGVFYDVLDNFTTHVAYRNFDAKNFSAPDDQVVEVGASYKFEISGSTTK